MMKVTRWHPDTCECIIDYEWDDTTTNENRVHTAKTIVRECAVHKGMDKHAHHDTVREENQRKNIAVGLIEEKHKDAKVRFEFDKDRNVVLMIDGITFEDKKALKKDLHSRVKISD